MYTIQLNKKVIITPDEIVFFESQANYTKIHFSKKEARIISVCLKKIERVLTESRCSFIRVHKSYLVNPRYIIGIRYKPIMEVKISDEIFIPVSRRRVKVLKENSILFKNP